MRKITLFLIMAAVQIAFIKCDNKNPEEPPVIDQQTERGKGIYINESQFHVSGIDTVYINQGDSLTLTASTILLNPPQYTWTSIDESVLKMIPDQNTDSIAVAVALGDSGQTTTLVITDVVNDAVKKVPVCIVHQWADPVLYRYVGKLDGHVYYQSNFKQNWASSMDMAKAAGGYLVTITSEEENDLVHLGRTDKDDNIWLGMTFLYGNTKLTKWITGEAVSYQNWSGSKPSEPGIFNENFICMYDNGKWGSEAIKVYYHFLEIE